METLTMPAQVDSPEVQTQKVLLLEDDPDLSQIVKDFLVSNSYEVVSVSNGVDGVREVMASDFDVILCDMLMPSLSGDMFYLAVERMRPHLCDRFIFITGHQGNPKITSFVEKVNGTVLPKPFQVDDLLDLVGFVQVRTGFN